MSLNIGAPRVKMIFKPIRIAIVPTMGPMALLTNDEIIMDNEATTIIESVPEQKAQKKRQVTSSLAITVTPLLSTIKSPVPNNKNPNP